MKLSDRMALDYFDIFIPFFTKIFFEIIFEETTYVTCQGVCALFHQTSNVLYVVDINTN